MLDGEPRDHIRALWPKHLEHLAPEGNKMGQGKIDPEEGVVCNCGEVLGFPKVQDEEEYLAEQRAALDVDPDLLEDMEASTREPEHHYDPEPDGHVGDGRESSPSGHPGEELTAVEAGWNDMVQGGNEGEQPLPCERDPEPHLVSEHPPDEAQATPPWSPTEEEYRRSHGMPPMASEPPSPGPPPAIPERAAGVVRAEDPLTARVVTIDPTLPYGPMDVEHQLLDINARIERGVHYQRYWEERGFSAKAGYELAWARAIVDSSGGAADVRKAQALLRCEGEYLELQLCETMIRAVRETMHNLRSLQSGMQTVSRSVSDSMRVPNSRP